MTTRSRVPGGGRFGAVLALVCGCAVALGACTSGYKQVPGVDVTRIVWGRNFAVPTAIPPKEINEVCRRSGPLPVCDYNYSSRDWAHRYADPGKEFAKIRKDVSVAYNCGSGSVGAVAYFTQVEDVPFHFDCTNPQEPRAWCGPTLDPDPQENCLKGRPLPRGR
jgi:hypothetical protein